MTPHREEPERIAADATDAVNRGSIESGNQTEPRVLEREVERTRPDAGLADATVRSRDSALLAPDVVENLKAQWSNIQAGFVDEPRRAVEQADGLVTDAIQSLAQSFSGERARLEAQWDRGDDVSTEDLRVALQRYRAFFSRLLSV
jgi:hypothetical protein